MTLIHHQQRILRKVVEQTRWRLTRRAAREIPRVVLDAGAIADLSHHLHVEQRALLEALRLHQLVLFAQHLQPVAQFIANGVDGPDHALLRRHVMRAGIHRVARHLALDLAGQRIEQRERLDRLVEQLHANRLARGLGREDVDDIAAHAIRTRLQVELIARVLHVGETAQQPALIHDLATNQMQDHGVVRLGVTQAVDSRHRRNDDRVLALQQRLGRREPHLLDVLVDRGVLLNISVAGRDVGLGLVIVVVRNEVFNRVLGEVVLELPVKLRRQRLVMCHHERGTLHPLDDPGMLWVFPLPVTPSSVWCLKPSLMPSTSFAIACGWSPAGW